MRINSNYLLETLKKMIRINSILPYEADLATFILYQLGALSAFVKVNGAELVHVKPHGALYNQAAQDQPMAQAIVRAVVRFDRGLILVGLANSYLIEAGLEAGLRAAREAFVDRAYELDGSLRSRRLPGAVLPDPAAAAKQAVSIARDGLVVACTGEQVAVQAETLCLHGDTPGAVQFAQAVREALAAAGVTVSSMQSFI